MQYFVDGKKVYRYLLIPVAWEHSNAMGNLFEFLLESQEKGRSTHAITADKRTEFLAQVGIVCH